MEDVTIRETWAKGLQKKQKWGGLQEFSLYCFSNFSVYLNYKLKLWTFIFATIKKGISKRYLLMGYMLLWWNHWCLKRCVYKVQNQCELLLVPVQLIIFLLHQFGLVEAAEPLNFHYLHHFSRPKLLRLWDCWGVGVGGLPHDRWGHVIALWGWTPESKSERGKLSAISVLYFPFWNHLFLDIPPHSDYSLPCQVNLKPALTHLLIPCSFASPLELAKAAQNFRC